LERGSSDGDCLLAPQAILAQFELVEAAGVEPDIGVENAQLIDSGNA
jgi:hypothetical protein